MEQEVFEIEIHNWEKFNPRNDVKATSWFRLNNNFLDDPEIFELNNTQKLIWVFILASASKNMSGNLKLSEELCALTLKTKKSLVIKTVIKFEEIGFLTLRSCDSDVFETYRYGRTNGRTDGRTNTTDSDCVRFLQLWNENSKSLPKANALSTSRKKHIRARLQENADLEYWRQIISKLSESEFCKGKNDRGWKADFDFLIKPETHIKASEGKYDNRTAQVDSKQAEKDKCLNGIF